MPFTLHGVYMLRNQSELRNACTGACMLAARDIKNEATDTPNHNNRMAWAFRSPDINAQDFMPIIAVNPDVQQKWLDRADRPTVERYDDNDIQYIVSSNIDKFATG